MSQDKNILYLRKGEKRNQRCDELWKTEVVQLSILLFWHLKISLRLPRKYENIQEQRWAVFWAMDEDEEERWAGFFFY